MSVLGLKCPRKRAVSVLGLKLSMEKSCVSAGPEAVHGKELWKMSMLGLKRAVSVLGLKLSTEKSCVSAGPEAVHGKELEKSCVSAGPEVCLCQCWA